MSIRLLRFFPFLAWFPLSMLTVRADLMAGITGALILVPKAMAYAQLSGLPLYFGLYTAFVPAIVGALWGSSRQLATGPVAIVSLMTAAAVTPLAVSNTPEYIGLALLLTFLVGLIQLLLGVLKLGTIVNFVSHPVILGFMNAAAIIIGLSQLDLILGIPKGRSDFFLKDIWEMLRLVSHTHLPTLGMALLGLTLLLGLKRVPALSKAGVLVAVVIATLVSALVGYDKKSGAVLEDIVTPQARGLVAEYEATSGRMKEVAALIADTSARQRQADKDGQVWAAAGLRHQVELARLDMRSLERRHNELLRGVRQLRFVRPEGMDSGPLYEEGEVPGDVVPDGRAWHIKAIDGGVMKLAGGGEVVGSVPAGLPSLQLPAMNLDAALQLLSAALIIAMVAFMESISMAKAMASKARQHIDPNQELIGQGLANIGGSFFQAYPACGSFTGSAINLQAGARTGLAMVFNGLFVAVTLLFFTPWLYHLPKAVLAVIIILAVVGLLTPHAFVHTWRANRGDGAVAAVTFVVTLLAAPHLDRGVIVGAVLSIGLYLYRTMSPRVAILGRYADGTLRDVHVHPGLATSHRVTVLRFDGSLYFANVAHFEDAVLKAVADHCEAKYLLVVGDAINFLDSSGEEMLQSLVGQLREAGVEPVFSGLKRQVLDVMRATSLYERIGDENIFATECQALKDIFQRLGEKVEDDALFDHVKAMVC
ncbi:SulP family inorganic anion transporter [Desulfomicrobium salsuginis]